MRISRVIELLADWARSAEKYWYPLPGNPRLGCYGSGYNGWGVQTNQKYLAAMATLAVRGEGVPGLDRQWALDRALAALRFSLWSHVTGEGSCTDGTGWGNTWISALGIERMMHAVHLLEPQLESADRAALQRLLVSEAGWLLEGYQHGKADDIAADPWNSSGRNHPESNIWNGALLWRTAEMYPDSSDAAEWRERAHRFLINGVSVATDAGDDSVVAGRSVRERHIGANFFPNYALDHHGYMNVGYMVICASNAAMLYFDMKQAGLQSPESLYHHQRDLWSVLRRMIFSNGRLARIGGDTRVRYCYCQDYLLPALLFAADRHEDGYALGLAGEQLNLIAVEARHNADGSFYGKRLRHMATERPYYYTRLESDRACVLSQYCAYLEATSGSGDVKGSFEDSVAGSWSEPEHGAVLHRSANRLAAFSWRAYKLAQGTCQRPDDPDLCDWEGNLGGSVEFQNSPYAQYARVPRHLQDRRLISCWQQTFPGGFVTSGAVFEGAEVEMAEGWRGKDMAVHHLAFAALPDGHTVVGLEYCRMGEKRGYVSQVKGMHFNLANDVYNDFERGVDTENCHVLLHSPAGSDGVMPLESRWASISGRAGLIGLYGAEQMVVSRSTRRRGGGYETLFVEEFCWPYVGGPQWFDPGSVLLDCGWMVVSGATTDRTRSLAGRACGSQLQFENPGLRGVSVSGCDGKTYLVIANFGSESCRIPGESLAAGERLSDLPGDRGPVGSGLEVAPGTAVVLQG